MAYFQEESRFAKREVQSASNVPASGGCRPACHAAFIRVSIGNQAHGVKSNWLCFACVLPHERLKPVDDSHYDARRLELLESVLQVGIGVSMIIRL